MNQFPNGISFCFPWRSYQKEVLEKLDDHLQNKHLHLVAPPGSGKTVLGIEVMLRLNEPTLIIAPTIAIRNQWVQRFTELFLQTENIPSWISTNIKEPQFMTVTTYQGLHALFQKRKISDSNSGNMEDNIEENEHTFDWKEREEAQRRFFQQNFRTLILDEAHHLRTSWWKTVISIKEKLIYPTTVALTATPPYDVGKAEWDKYMELCGPIDEEIEVAALVKEGDLCPHQDYVWMSSPTNKEKGPIENFHQQAKNLLNDILHNKNFINFIESHPWMNKDEYIEEKLDNYQAFISMIIFLKEVGSPAWKIPFQLIGDKEEKLPDFDLEWLEQLLTFLLYKDPSVNTKEEPLINIRKTLSNIGALDRGKVRLITTKAMERTLLQSASKLDSIVNIVTLEKQSQKDALRLVVLADYIYRNDLPSKKSEERSLHRLGVIPIFEKIRREIGEQCQLGVLTGSIVIIPKSAVDLLNEFSINFQVKPLSHDERYMMLETNTSAKQHVVTIITEIFSKGAIDVLIGTTALLGEGWDAPSVNTLILASNVGTFMLSNQMRGRAIRTERGNPNKTANIWHLVCIDEHAPNGGYDYESLKRRFRSLTGIDEQFPIITTGLERLRLSHQQFSAETISYNNVVMETRATNRKRLFDRWQEAVHTGEKKREEFHTHKEAIPRPFVLRNTIKSLVIISLSIIIDILYSIGDHGLPFESGRKLFSYLNIGLIVGLFLSAPYWLKALRLFIFNSSIESNFKQVGKTIYHTLYEIGLIQTEPKQNEIHVMKGTDGEVVCYLENGTKHEQKLFIECLQQFTDPIDNPRYILHRKSGKRLWVRHDYHAVPEVIGKKKDYAETFLSHWNKWIGNGSLIYTRTKEGRKMLLKARMRAMANQFNESAKRLSIWR